MPLRSALLAALFLASLPTAGLAQPADQPSYLYKVTLVRAAPGKLLDLIDLQQNYGTAYEVRGDAAPFWMRHSQGDQWDLMFLFPMESYAAHYHPDRIAQRRTGADAQAQFDATWRAYVAWQEDLFAYGPALEDLRRAFSSASFFHVEMFQALPGKHDELYAQRQMENAYYAALDRPQNMIFVRDQGARWDVFTLGFYDGLQHFAESANITLEDDDRAARAAGFESVYAISPYLRSLILEHHDTLAVTIR